MVASICFTQTFLQATDRPNLSRIGKAVLALTALGTAGKIARTFPEATAAFTGGVAAGGLVTAGVYHVGWYTGIIYDDRSSKTFITGTTGALALGTSFALRAAKDNNYINYNPAIAVAACVGFCVPATFVAIDSWCSQQI